VDNEAHSESIVSSSSSKAGLRSRTMSVRSIL
jgi:hypothetical protein